MTPGDKTVDQTAASNASSCSQMLATWKGNGAKEFVPQMSSATTPAPSASVSGPSVRIERRLSNVCGQVTQMSYVCGPMAGTWGPWQDGSTGMWSGAQQSLPAPSTEHVVVAWNFKRGYNINGFQADLIDIGFEPDRRMPLPETSHGTYLLY